MTSMAPEGTDAAQDLHEAVPDRRRLVTWADPRRTAESGRDLAGLAFLHAMMAGDVPPPPAIRLLGIDLVEAARGRATMTMRADEHLYNPLGCVHGGLAATLLDSVMGCAVHSTLPPGRSYTTLEIKVNYLRAMTEASGLLTAVGEVVHEGRRQAVAESRLTDETGHLCAIASTTCLVFDIPEPSAAGGQARSGPLGTTAPV